MSNFALSNDNREWLMRRAKQAAPYESCGFIMESGDVIEIRNVAHNPMREFKMDRQQMCIKLSYSAMRNDLVIGIWHTHPSGSVAPSATDLKAINCGAIQRDWRYFIATADEVREYATNTFAIQENSFWEAFAR